MLNDGHIYLVDTDVLRCIDIRKDSDEIYDDLVKLAAIGRIKTVIQVFDELETQLPKPRWDKLKPHRKSFEITTAEQYDKGVSDIIEILGNQAKYLWEQTGGKNPDPADPWNVAVASRYNYTLVTNESPRSTRMTPAACRLDGTKCRCSEGRIS